MGGIAEPDGMPVDRVPCADDVAAERRRCLAIVRELRGVATDGDSVDASLLRIAERRIAGEALCERQEIQQEGREAEGKGARHGEG